MFAAMAMQVTRLQSFFRDKYNALRYGDVFKNWDQLMRLVRVTDSDEAYPTTRKMKVLSSTLFALWMAFTLFRITLSVFWITGMSHIMGQTMSNSGNVSKLIVSLAGVCLVQWFLYRLVCILLLLNGDMIFMQTLQSMVCRHGIEMPQTSRNFRIQESEEIRDRKIQLARLIYSAVFLSRFPMAINGYIAVTGYLWLNIQASETTFQICSWIFWYVQDLIMATAFAFDFLIYPSMWFVVALNYRMDIMSLTAKIQQLTQVRGAGVGGKRHVLLFRGIRDDYLRLTQQAVRVNRFSSPILLVLVLSTTPILCICVFLAVYSDNLLLQLAVPTVGCVISLFACSLLAIAADITARSEKLYEVLCAAAARQSVASHSSVRERRFLLLMMEHASAETNSFAMTTMDGQKYTMQSFVSFLIETGLQYTLLFTFNRGIAYQ